MARGQLRIYLGAAPGVGKTFAMLNEGRRRHQRGTDVVAGFVEAHGRPRTQEAIGDLEVLPRRTIEHRGTTFEEMDVDGLLARKPEVALVDELAHTNVPGSRNEKRWQDIRELLNAGIDVVSTVNIQHLESVNDVVERITGVLQRETVPDDVVREADQVELVDMTPEALRRRMAHGNIYPADRIDPALTNYFRPGNLAALRELALLWVADQVDEALEEYRERHGITEPWETRERVLVALTGAPGTEALIRRAARVAQRAHGELLGVHVRSGDGLAGASSSTLDAHHRLLEDLGGEYHEVVGSDVAKALVDFARAENCTQLVLGASHRSRVQELLRGSVINQIIRLSSTIDVHVISHAPDDEPTLAVRRRRRTPGGLSVRRQIAGWVLAMIALIIVTAVLAGLRDTVGLPGVLLIYMLVVVVVAVVGGALPAIGSAIVAFLLANWYFTPPIHKWTIAEGENVLALVVFVIVAAIVSTVVATSARRSADATRARAEAEILVRLAATVTADDPLRVLVAYLRSSFGLDAVAILRRIDGTWAVETSSGSEIPTSPEQADVVDELAPDVVLALRGRQLTADDQRVLSAFGAQLAAALERTRLALEAASAGALAQTNELRAALLQAVSHDLRTPLAAIKASVSSLRQDDVAWGKEETAEFLEAIEEQTDRLTGLVANLLDMSRLQAGVVEPQLRAVGFDEVVPAAVASLLDGGAAIDADLPETLPQVLADPALLERVIANLLDNAVSVCPKEHRVRVVASPIGAQVALHIVDRGPGLPRSERDRVFEPFQRSGDQRPATGVGLGLAVARGFVQAMQGELRLDDTPGGGLTAIVTLPCAPSAASSAAS